MHWYYLLQYLLLEPIKLILLIPFELSWSSNRLCHSWYYISYKSCGNLYSSFIFLRSTFYEVLLSIFSCVLTYYCYFLCNFDFQKQSWIHYYSIYDYYYDYESCFNILKSNLVLFNVLLACNDPLMKVWLLLGLLFIVLIILIFINIIIVGLAVHLFIIDSIFILFYLNFIIGIILL